jgi:hypothetical protein
MKSLKQEILKSFPTVIFQEITIEILVHISRYSYVSVCEDILICTHEFYLIIREIICIVFSIAGCCRYQMHIYLRK